MYSLARSLLWDHPRACGENDQPWRAQVSVLGSPPRVRGKQLHPHIILTEQRITPARAGKTERDEKKDIGAEDHPRACGENLYVLHRGRQGLGSPPRVRGKPDIHNSGGYRERITPARAGKTERLLPYRRRAKDHPRACGENKPPSFSASGTEGSPPRVRGKLLIKPRERVFRRITPARAGKTFLNKDDVAVHKDHPRACGENAQGSM